MATKAAERFASLLEEWRNAHTRFLNFSLFLCHAGNLDEPHKDAAQRAQDCDCEVIGTLRIPILSQPKALLDSAFLSDLTRKVPLETLHSDDDMRRFGDQIMKRPRRECIVYAPTQRGTDDVEAFRDLADRSGRELPLPIRNSVPWDFAPPGFADRWLAMLFWCDLPDAAEMYAMNAPSNGWTILSFSPFEKSADTIELCRLDSDQPRFAWQQWPQWAGHAPQTAITETPSQVPKLESTGASREFVSDAAAGQKSRASKKDSVRKSEAEAVLLDLLRKDPDLAAVEHGSAWWAERVEGQTKKACSASLIRGTTVWKKQLSPRTGAARGTRVGVENAASDAAIEQLRTSEMTINDMHRRIDKSNLSEAVRNALSDQLELGQITPDDAEERLKKAEASQSGLLAD
jgi:hypothetical protein